MSPERTNYSRIPAGMRIEIQEDPELQKSLTGIVRYGMEFSRGKVMDSTSISTQVAGQREVFINYLSYVVFGRIVDLSSRCPEDKKEVCVSVKFAQELGEIINQRMAVAKKNLFKGVDFTQEEGRAITGRAFKAIHVETWFLQLNELERNQVRKFGSTIIPENPPLEQKPSQFRLE